MLYWSLLCLSSTVSLSLYSITYSFWLWLINFMFFLDSLVARSTQWEFVFSSWIIFSFLLFDCVFYLPCLLPFFLPSVLSLYCFFCFSVCLATMPCLDPVQHEWLCPLSSQYNVVNTNSLKLSTLPKTCLYFFMTHSSKPLRPLPVHSCSFYITRTCPVGGVWLGTTGTLCWAVWSLSWSPWLVLHQGWLCLGLFCSQRAWKS